MPTAMTFNNKAMTFGSTPKWMAVQSSDPYNPLGLPPYTIRLKFTDSTTPTFSIGTATQVSSSPNVWDLTYANNDWTGLIADNSDLISVLGANATGVTRMHGMFSGCTALTEVPLFDTGSCTNMYAMFYGCAALTEVPLFDTGACTDMYGMFASCTVLTTVPLFNTSSCTNMDSMFNRCSALTTVPLFNTSSCTNMESMFYSCSYLASVPLFNTSSCTNMNNTFYRCVRVQSGALALYQQASSQAIPPSSHSSTFYRCGYNTTSGKAELNQIPSDWK